MGMPARLKSLAAPLTAMAAALAAMILWDRFFVSLLLVDAIPIDADAAMARHSLHIGMFSSAMAGASVTSAWGMWSMIFQASLLGPLLEELTFRWPVCAITYRKDGTARDDWSLPVLVLLSGLVFASLHGFRYGFDYLLVVRLAPEGLVLAALWLWARRRYQSVLKALLCCTLVHGAYNFTVTVHDFADQQARKEAIKAGYELGKAETAQQCLGVLQQLPEGCFKTK